MPLPCKRRIFMLLYFGRRRKLMENRISQNISLQQKQVLSEQQQQSLELLNMPLQELELHIRKELAENPLLEELTPLQPDLPGEPEKQEPADPDDSLYSMFETERNTWGDSLPSERGYCPAAQDEDSDFWSNSPAPPPSMAEQLDSEIATSDLPLRMQELATGIIDSLDERGFVATPLADLAMQFDADMDEVLEALKLVQSFDPPGIAARDLGECLRLQLERQGKCTDLMQKITRPENLELIAENRIPQLASQLEITIAQLTAALAELKKLDPFPGSSQAPEITEPEIEIYHDGKNYAVKRLHGREKTIFIPERYEKLLQDPATSPEDRFYIAEKIRSARELIKALHNRSSTITGIGEVLIQTQQNFFENGIAALKPLTMKQAGEILGRDESTISRAVNGKSVRTPQGVFQLKYFFAGGYKNEEGEDVSSRAVKEKLRELVKNEDPHNPLSDDKLARLLNDDGLPVARRTIAKYRELLGIPNTRLWKKY